MATADPSMWQAVAAYAPVVTTIVIGFFAWQIRKETREHTTSVTNKIAGVANGVAKVEEIVNSKSTAQLRVIADMAQVIARDHPNDETAQRAAVIAVNALAADEAVQKSASDRKNAADAALNKDPSTAQTRRGD